MHSTMSAPCEYIKEDGVSKECMRMSRYVDVSASEHENGAQNMKPTTDDDQKQKST